MQDEGGNELLITRSVWTLAVSQVAVAVSLTLEELITAALPLTPWWKRNLPSIQALLDGADGNAEVRWMYQIVGTLVLCSREPSSERERSPEDLWFGDDRSDTLRDDDDDDDDPLLTDPGEIAPRATNADYERFRQIVRDHEGQRREFERLARRALELSGTQAPELLWSIGLNRRARSAIYRSVSATKADAARRLFDVQCQDLTWAVVDTGIDATHRAFLDSTGETKYKPGEAIAPGDSRVKASYDFTRLRKLITLDSHPSTGPSALDQGEDLEEADRRFKQMRQRLRSGTVARLGAARAAARASGRRRPSCYRPPAHDHGTHVAGILGAQTTTAERRTGHVPRHQPLRPARARRATAGRRVLDHRRAAVHPLSQRDAPISRSFTASI